MSIRRASFEATYSTGVDVDLKVKGDEDTYKVLVENWNETIGVYSWDFDEIDDTYASLVAEIGLGSIIGVQLMFSYNLSQDAVAIDVIKYGTGNPEAQTGAQILAQYTVDVLGTADITSTSKTSIILDIEDYNLFYEMTMLIVARSPVSFIMQRSRQYDDSTGSVEVGGTALIAGTSEWRAAVGSESAAPPRLIIIYEVDEESHPTLNMKYTTSTPLVNQQVPSDSIGGYLAFNDVYPSAQIGSSISSVQTTIPIDADSDMPTGVGLASVGPETFRYTTVDSASHQLTGVTRGVSPLRSFPAGFDSFRMPEQVYYLHPDSNDLNLLFDTRAASGLVQYRCVAIANVDTNDNFNIGDGAAIGVVQDSSSNVQIIIGVEFPRYDARTGTAEDDVNPTSDSLLVDTSFTEDAGFFDGAFIKFLAPVEYSTVDSFTGGEFVLATPVVGLVAGRSFVIMPAPAQTIATDATAPTSNSGLFTGFDENLEGIEIVLSEHSTYMGENDLFYVWIRRTLTDNVQSGSDTGAVLVFRFKD